MGRSSTSRLFAVAPLLGAATAYRMGVSYLTTWCERTPELVDLWFEAWEQTADAPAAAEEFHRRLIATADKSAELVVEEFKRGLDEVGHWTRPDEPAAQSAASE